jgi:arginyl-tRNA synthetase
MNILHELQDRLRQSLAGLVADPEPYVAMLRPAQDPRHGDYQANCAMPLAKVLAKPPREIATAIAERLPLGEVLGPPEVAGPGFINLRLRDDWLARQVQLMAAGDRLGVAPAASPRTFVIDYSSPNVAKPMHVGHLRSTIIGDALTRLLRFLGHHVVTDNHLGDWGTQFGMLLYGYKHHVNDAALRDDPVREMVRLYILVRDLIRAAEAVEENPNAAAAYPADQLARSQEVLAAVGRETARLHEGDGENRGLWQTFMPWCLEEIEGVYRLLGILPFDHTHGESFYHDMLADVVRDLMERGIAQPSQGAIAVLFGEEEAPALIRYSNGAYTYTTSDLATIRYRVEHWHPDAILYVVGAPQALHFRNLFAIARRWGYDKVELRHLPFGSVLGEDRRTIRTREGGAIELEHLLREAIERAAEVYERNRQAQIEREGEVVELSPEERRQVAEVVGIGAVKYADLCQNAASDYVFSWDKMLAMEGNTATYMQYAYARNRSIFRKGEVDVAALRANPPPVMLTRPEERALALQLLRFSDALQAAAAEYRPNLITAYLWDTAKAYSGFFQNCPVLKAETPELRQSRLLLCDLTARVIQRGLDLLGIRTVERM